MSENRIFIIAGPTASGKSALAIDLALKVVGVVLNADSMQVYQGLPVITACPSLEDRQKVEHRLFEIYDCAVRGNVVDWLDRAEKEIRALWKENKCPVVVGGTGFYIDQLINGTTPVPETSAPIRQEIADIYNNQGIEAVFKCLEQEDPLMAKRLNPNDKTRISRALEVIRDTGVSLAKWYEKPMIYRVPEANFYVIKICPTTEELDKRCYKRFDQMIGQGALEEVVALQKRELNPDLPAMKALGVPELLDYLQGVCTLEEAVFLAKQHTRQYAKRQRTWFRNKLTADFTLDHCYVGAPSDIPV